MKTFTASEFEAFIREMPDNAPLRMDETSLEDPCGCLLVQFARSRGLKEGSAAMVEIYSGHGETAKDLLKAEEGDVDRVYQTVRKALYSSVCTFAQAKELLT